MKSYFPFAWGSGLQVIWTDYHSYHYYFEKNILLYHSNAFLLYFFKLSQTFILAGCSVVYVCDIW